MNKYIRLSEREVDAANEYIFWAMLEKEYDMYGDDLDDILIAALDRMLTVNLNINNLLTEE